MEQMDVEEKPTKEELQNHNPQQTEALKLKDKYPHLTSGSHFLQKRLQQHKKYFDSGDYNMAKAKGQLKLPVLSQKQVVSAVETEKAVVADDNSELRDASPSPPPPEVELGTKIPTPESIPHRKTSLIQTDVASKLSPHPLLIHHTATSPSPVSSPVGERPAIL